MNGCATIDRATRFYRVIAPGCTCTQPRATAWLQWKIMVLEGSVIGYGQAELHHWRGDYLDSEFTIESRRMRREVEADQMDALLAQCAAWATKTEQEIRSRLASLGPHRCPGTLCSGKDGGQ